MGPRNTTEGHAAASTYNWSQERPGGPAGLGGWGVTITQLADREDSRSDIPYCNTACLAESYLNSNQEDKVVRICIFM